MISTLNFICITLVYLTAQFKVSIKQGIIVLISFIIGCILTYSLTYQSIHSVLHQNDGKICIEERL